MYVYKESYLATLHFWQKDGFGKKFGRMMGAAFSATKMGNKFGKTQSPQYYHKKRNLSKEKTNILQFLLSYLFCVALHGPLSPPMQTGSPPGQHTGLGSNEQHT